MPWLERREEIPLIDMPEDASDFAKLYVSAHNHVAKGWNRQIRRDNHVLDAFDQVRQGPRLIDRARGAGVIFGDVVRTITMDPATEIAERIGIIKR